MLSQDLDFDSSNLMIYIFSRIYLSDIQLVIIDFFIYTL
nr:MAG TPA: hypothetical protein [Crassvirales sp.]